MSAESYAVLDPRREVVYGQVWAVSAHDACLKVMNTPVGHLLDGAHAREIEVEPVSELADGVWREVAPVGPGSNGDCGGDVQVSESFSRRFALARADGTWSVVTYAWYAINESVEWVTQDTEGEVIERQAELIICNDLRELDYAIWSDTTYEKVADCPADEAGALRAAQEFTVADIDWDGEPLR
jgi:hypothetical protein